MRKQKALLTVISALPLLIALLMLIALWAGTLGEYRSQCYLVSGDSWVVPEVNTVQPSLFFRYTGGDLKVLADGKTVYEKQTVSRLAERFSGSRSLIVELPEDVAGKKLEIKISIEGTEVNTLVEAPLYGSHNAVFHLFLYQALPALVIGSFQLIFGIIFLFLTVGFSVTVSGVADHILGAAICINFGMWLFSSGGILPLFMRTPYDTIVEIGTSLLILPLLLFMLYTLNNRRSYLEVGIWIFAACMVFYLIFAASESMNNVRMHDLATLLPNIGCISFSVTQILNYYLNITASYARQEEYMSLTEKAYIDALTGLPNRKSADNVFRSLNSTAGSYCIVSMDLDNLKIINDTYGHEAGDSMLKAASDTLIECVGELGFRARMGGDEFVLVLKRVPENAVQSLLEEIEEKLNGAGIVRHRIPYSISYGYAFREERRKGTALDIYNLADERMYEQKSEKKRQRILEATLAQEGRSH